jgi:hypothetical protein
MVFPCFMDTLPHDWTIGEPKMLKKSTDSFHPAIKAKIAYHWLFSANRHLT